jgi:hypothetical protein
MINERGVTHMEQSQKTIALVSSLDLAGAERAVAALSDAGIPACMDAQYNSVPPAVSLPGVFGAGAISGYSIIVAEPLAEKAVDVLIGIGCLTPTEETPEEETPAADSSCVEQSEETEDTEDRSYEEEIWESADISYIDDTEDTGESAEPQALPSRAATVLGVVLFLLALSVVVIGTDAILEFIRSLFQ